MDEMRDRIARLDATIERAKSLPSWPTMAARLERLTQAIETLTARVEALEQESIPLVDTHGLTPVALAKEVCIYLEGCMPSNSL
jgi:hypothetical protein